MSFPDVGRLVTPEEVVAFVKPMANTIDMLATVCIESVEDMVEDYCQRKFELTEYEDESYIIRKPSESFDGWITAARHEFRLKNRPVIEFTDLKHVTQRDSVTGLPVNPVTLSRSLYHVELNPGIVIFDAPLLNLATGNYPQQFLGGYAGNPYIELLANYEAGFDVIPPRLKLAVLMAISRVYRMTIDANWHRTQTQTTGVQAVWQEFIRNDCGLTPEEKMILDAFRTPVAA